MKVTSAYNWNENSYWVEVTSKLHAAAKPFSNKTVFFDPILQSRKQEGSYAGAGKLHMLQNEHMAVDITDRGFGILPFQLDGRYYGRLSFRIREGEQDWTTHIEEGNNTDTVRRSNVFEPGRHLLKGLSSSGFEFEVRTVLPPSFPFMVVELSLLSKHQDETVKISPEFTWMPGSIETLNETNGAWLSPKSASHADPFLAQNHSITADPPRPPIGIPAGMGVAMTGTLQSGESFRNVRIPSKSSVTLSDREFASSELARLQLGDLILNVKAGQKSTIYCLIGVASSQAQYVETYKRWIQLDSQQLYKELNYWPSVSDQISFSCPDKSLTTQSRYSVHNSLFSRSRTSDGLTLFVHGRPDRGYGDCAKLHQSYQMHYAALASGETESVKEELIAYAALQDERGDMAKQLRPGAAGSHPYAGMYSNAHFIMALHRYISWSGDMALLDQAVINRSGQQRELTMLERAKLAAEWLLENRWNGLIAPCGWLDAWPPQVKAQAQISITAYMALRELMEICEQTKDSQGQSRYELAAADLKQRILEVFYDGKTGLFAEHLFESGEIAGKETHDFWAHTQIWAALAGLSPDTRGLDLCREYCLGDGMAIIPESAIFSDYLSESTDGVEDLSFGFTATWLLAAWPEVTHLYALAELRYGRVNEALDAVRRQLPEHLHSMKSGVSPYHYAEKYLYPHDVPWLCTWSGDPTLLQVLLEGFGGIQVNLSGLKVIPRLPDSWGGEERLHAKFQWRGYKMNLEVDCSSSKLILFQCNGKPVSGNEVEALKGGGTM